MRRSVWRKRSGIVDESLREANFALDCLLLSWRCPTFLAGCSALAPHSKTLGAAKLVQTVDANDTREDESPSRNTEERPVRLFDKVLQVHTV